MDCSYMNQPRPCPRCSQMMPLPKPAMDCGCTVPPTSIPDRSLMEGHSGMSSHSHMADCPHAMPGSPQQPEKRHWCPDTRPGGMERYPVAMGYVPWQQWQQTYPLDRALQRGTIFPDMDLPFVMGRCQ